MGAGKSYPYRYNGKELNEEFGLSLQAYGGRWYEPAVSRWTTVDPLAEKMPEWSTYNYTMGNPINLVDPDGRLPQSCCGGPTIADEFIPSLIAAGYQLWHSVSRNTQILFGGEQPENIPYRKYSTQWNGERSVVVYTEHRIESSTSE